MSGQLSSEARAFEAAELRTYAGVIGDPELAARARDLGAAAPPDRAGPGVPDEATRAAAVEADPVSAAGLGWLSYPRLQEIVAQDPDRHLDEDEVAAYRRDPTSLRLVVLARVDGRAFADVQAEYGSDQYALAARGGDEGAQRVWEMLGDQGLLDGEDPSTGR